MDIKLLKRIGIVSIVIILFFLVFFLIFKNDNKYKDTVKYKGKTYVYLEYNADIFTYNYNGNDYLEEDIIHPIKHDKWNMVYFNGDLFVIKKQVKEAIAYYADDKNYEWFFVTEDDDTQIIKPIHLTEEELEFIYSMDTLERDETILFSDIKLFGDITKVSKDKTITSLISLAYYKDNWYWKSEVMKDDDYEYAVKLPDSLNDKIKNLMD